METNQLYCQLYTVYGIYFLEDEETLVKVPSILPLLLGSVKSPRIPMNIKGEQIVVLLDTGAEVSVLPKFLMDQLTGDGSRHVRLRQTKAVRPFANPDVQIQGPWCLTVTICGVKLTHPFYTMDADVPIVVGIDLLTAAKVVIDVMNKCVYSHHYARLEVEPCTVQHEPVFLVDNIVHFNPLFRSTVSEAVQSDTSTLIKDLGGPSAPSGVGARVNSPLSDARERPSFLAPSLVDVSPSATGDSCYYATGLESCCTGSLYPPSAPPLHSASQLSPTAPSFYPEPTLCSSTSLAPAVRDTSLSPSTAYISPPATRSSQSLPPKVVPRPPLPPDPPDSPPPPDPPDPPPDPPWYSTGAPPRSSPQPPLTAVVRCAESDTQVKSTEFELPEHVNLLFLQTVENNSLSSEVTADLKALLNEHASTFAKDSSDLGFCDILQHDIDTGDARPIKQYPRRPPLAATAAQDEILDEMLQTGVIEPSCSPRASPVCLVKKKEGTYRFCVDYRRVNSVSKRDASPSLTSKTPWTI